MRRLILVLLTMTCSLLCLGGAAQAVEPKGNVLILFGNEYSLYSPAELGPYDNDRDYEGYFDSKIYYEYANKVFVPVGRTAADHYVSETGDYWSGNFLNWVTMSNVDLVRKIMTGGRRSVDTKHKNALERAFIKVHPWNKKYAGADMPRLVPAAYANATNRFVNVERTLEVFDASKRSIGGPFVLSVEVCNPGFLDPTCRQYGYGVNRNYKPEGMLQRSAPLANFGLMTYSFAPEHNPHGGVLRVPLGSIVGEFSTDNGRLLPGNGIINMINADEYTGWGPLAEMYYDALRYLKGNEAAQAAYCGGEILKDGGYPVYGCDSRQPWVDPVTDPCQRQQILMISDGYPSKDYDDLPGSAFNPGYVDAPAGFGANFPYNPDVSALTDQVGDAEGITNSVQMYGNYLGYEKDWCKQGFIPNLSRVYGLCPDEIQSFGSFYLPGLVHQAFTGDLRPDLPGRQKIWTKALVAGTGDSLPKMNPVWLAAKYGYYFDRNKNFLPDLGEFADVYDGQEDLYGLGYAEEGLGGLSTFVRPSDVDGVCGLVDDSDGDGIVDGDDRCPNDPTNGTDNNGVCVSSGL